MAAKKKKAARRKTKTAASKTRPAETKSAAARRARDNFLVCGIGSSAGGLNPMEAFFRHVPGKCGMAFVVISHHKADHASLLSQLLQRYTDMPVVDAGDGMAVEPDHVYVSTPGKDLILESGILHVKPATLHKDIYLPIDGFFRSLAADRHENAAGIILSGTGSDGTLGLKAIKAEYGLVMAQSPDSAEYRGMPESAIQHLEMDFILPPEEMPARLLDYARSNVPKPAAPAVGEQGLIEPHVEKILDLLRDRTSRDFSDYKISSIRRRIARRMALHQLAKAEEYIQYLQHNAHEIDLLFKELLITVTQFFRDPEAWEALEEKGLPQLLPVLSNDEPFRAWVVGCATGEEAYSLAILLNEFFSAHDLHPEVQIFATDLDEHSINIARAGVYSQGIAADVGPERLERYFSFEDGHYHVRKEIREMVVFAIQDVARDPPFLNLDLVTCRNLLIYMHNRLQQRILPMFHYALKQHGLLLLGSSETLGNNEQLFTALDRKWRLFARRAVPATAWLQTPTDRFRQKAALQPKPAPLATVPQRIRDNHLTRLAEHLFVKMFVPPSVIINEEGDIYFIQGRTSPFLEPPTGHPHMNLFDMARRGLRLDLVTAVRKAAAAGSREPVRRTLEILSDDRPLTVDIEVTWLDEPDMLRGLLLVTFNAREPAAEKQPIKEEPAKKKKPLSDREQGRVQELELELQHMRESLQTTVEELETSNEELRASNEELQSTNEELQSTNEELETSKEEMQSLNEELTTVNAELQSKVDELAQVSDDMINLLNSTGVATLFLDNQLRINRFNQQATELFKLISSDVGRPISDLTSNLDYTGLVDDAKRVLETLKIIEMEIRVKDGTWRQMRLSPYRTSDNAIEGVVITFVDITELKSSARFSEEARSLADRIVQTVRIPLLILDDKLRVVTSNRAFYETFRLKPKLVEEELVYEIGGGEWDIPELRRLLGEVLSRNASFEGYQVRHDFPRIGRHVMNLNAKALIEEKNRPHLILLAIEDITAEESQP